MLLSMIHAMREGTRMAANSFSPTSSNDNFYSEHEEHDFCYDMTCPCHEDKYLVEELAEAVQDGEASVDDANNIYRGRTV
jgi:hypothetical protein